MSETIDPLLFLREYLIYNKPITVIDKHLDFGNGVLRLPLDTQTAWQRRDKKGLYNLGSLYLIVVNKDTKMSDYGREAAKIGVPLVDFKDKQEVVDYLTGKINECQQIDASVRA